MCGIAGFFGALVSGHESETVLRRMAGCIHHRGPDENGIWTNGKAGFAHTRLSIIDLSSGQQPMHSADGALTVTFNGEIFNYRELKTELEKSGAVFRTSSDTEVILQAYRHWGDACVNHFNGDFAFALYDAPRQRLFAARDRMGVRPFFHTRHKGTLFFGSEIKTLLAAGIPAEIDPIALDQIFTFWFPLAPRTGFKDICELPPGHTLVAQGDELHIAPYWRLEFPDASDAHLTVDENAIREEVRALLENATRLRLRADVPVGAYLSGGLDSSIITALVSRIQPGKLHTFSVGFDNPEFDETSFQDAMVEALGTEHLSVLTTPKDIGAMFPAVIEATERPILRTAPAPLFRLSELVQQNGYKVVLTGEGADEVFAGYDIFKEDKIRRFMARQPESTIRPQLLRRLYPYLPRLSAQNPAYLQAFFASKPGDSDDPLFAHLPRSRTTAGAKVFFSSHLREQIGRYEALDDLRNHLPADFTRWHPLHQAQYLESAFLLPGYILSSQGDRMAMAHAVEGRFPFLDHRVVEHAARIPPRLKMRGLREKHILREAFSPILPEAIAHRTKQPYRAPDAPSFAGPDAPAWMADATSPDALAKAGLFEPHAVEKLLAKCASGRHLGFKDNTALVGIASAQVWAHKFITGSQG
jgi:asparagine synthase (glutamine-hydrolysing)